ncbi:MAG: DUF455 family protein [Planctomycetota bacterium]|nr:DUF455 family protein [Planctomycetota bacterium]
MVPSPLETPLLPPEGTVERACWDLIAATSWEGKRAPRGASWWKDPVALRPSGPGRPAQLEALGRAPRTPRPGALRRPEARGALFVRFLHHELQAAELFAFGVLAFPETPRAFREGLVRLAQEELGHLALYRDHAERLGVDTGSMPIRDWFWTRVHGCERPEQFVAFLGLGLEGANLDHSARFAAAFRAAGDAEGAAILERVGRDEGRHVAFSRTWFERFTGTPLSFEDWQAALPAPLSAGLFRGEPVQLEARAEAGLDAAFLDSLVHAPRATEARE